MVFSGSEVEPNATLAQAGIDEDGSTMHMVLRLKSGPPSLEDLITQDLAVVHPVHGDKTWPVSEPVSLEFHLQKMIDVAKMANEHVLDFLMPAAKAQLEVFELNADASETRCWIYTYDNG
jgi:hypothetical protein